MELQGDQAPDKSESGEGIGIPYSTAWCTVLDNEKSQEEKRWSIWNVVVQLNYKQREMGRQKANYYANGSLPLGSLFIVILYIAALGIYRVRVLADPLCYECKRSLAPN